MEANEIDQAQTNAIAAQGYWQGIRLFTRVSKVLHGERAGEVAEEHHRTWYREMFAPSVAVALLRPADLASYRTDRLIPPVKHVSFSRAALRDTMLALFESAARGSRTAGAGDALSYLSISIPIWTATAAGWIPVGIPECKYLQIGCKNYQLDSFGHHVRMDLNVRKNKNYLEFDRI